MCPRDGAFHRVFFLLSHPPDPWRVGAQHVLNYSVT